MNVSFVLTQGLSLLSAAPLGRVQAFFCLMGCFMYLDIEGKIECYYSVLKHIDSAIRILDRVDDVQFRKAVHCLVNCQELISHDKNLLEV